MVRGFWDFMCSRTLSVWGLRGFTARDSRAGDYKFIRLTTVGQTAYLRIRVGLRNTSGERDFRGTV